MRPVEAPRMGPLFANAPVVDGMDALDLAETETASKDGEVVRETDEFETPLGASGSVADISSMVSRAAKMGEGDWVSTGSRRRNL
jgi:hypothetical protein